MSLIADCLATLVALYLAFWLGSTAQGAPITRWGLAQLFFVIILVGVWW